MGDRQHRRMLSELDAKAGSIHLLEGSQSRHSCSQMSHTAHTPHCRLARTVAGALTALNWVLSFRQTSIRDWDETKRSSHAFSLLAQARACKHRVKEGTRTTSTLAVFTNGHAAHRGQTSFLVDLKNIVLGS